MSNYPPGVTGNEYEIAGPSWEGEVEVDHECPECGWSGSLTIDAEGYGGTRWGDIHCPDCGHRVEWEDEGDAP